MAKKDSRKIFLRKFFHRIEPQPSTCWFWCGCNNLHYGKIWYKGKYEFAHRVAWMIFYGKIPIRMNVLHRCDTGLCVNPNHLFLGNQSDNMIDCAIKGRIAKSKLSKSQVSEIKKSLACLPDSYHNGTVELARKYGVTRETIQQIRRRNTWKTVEV